MIRILVLLSFLWLAGCVQIAKPYDQLPPGIWRAELQIAEDVVLPFNMEISYEGKEMKAQILNAEERIPIKDISFGRTRDLRDTVVFSFPLMDSYIDVDYKENVIEGIWHVNNRENYEVPFVAYHGQSHRFFTDQKTPVADLTGKWAATFDIETEDAYPAIGEFQQSTNELTGTFLTETGDYRYLEGGVNGDKFALSCFDGSHAFLFKGDILESGQLAGKFYSGNHWSTNWVARRDADATLKDPSQMSSITTPNKKINFSLPNTSGKLVTLDDAIYKNKAKLVTIMGTWCPNCLDESKFLLDYLEKHPDLEVEIIALAFERYKNPEKAKAIIKTYKERLDIPYEILYAGHFNKQEATKSLGWIDEVISYPTLLFVDGDNTVQKVYTGFSGPATSEYVNFVAQFEKDITRLTSK